MFFFFPFDIHFSTKKSGKSLWNFKIHIICNVVLFFFGIACTNECYFGFTLEYFKFWEAAVAYFL